MRSEARDPYLLYDRRSGEQVGVAGRVKSGKDESRLEGGLGWPTQVKSSGQSGYAGAGSR